tara:strand:+ start:188 stop:400 length:213 start_codon:yes stop_codon:yes gene_type:complete
MQQDLPRFGFGLPPIKVKYKSKYQPSIGGIEFLAPVTKTPSSKVTGIEHRPYVKQKKRKSPFDISFRGPF